MILDYDSGAPDPDGDSGFKPLKAKRFGLGLGSLPSGFYTRF
jgi:hypothetical protein